MKTNFPFILSYEKIEKCDKCEFCSDGHCYVLNKLVELTMKDMECPIIDDIAKHIITRKVED